MVLPGPVETLDMGAGFKSVGKRLAAGLAAALAALSLSACGNVMGTEAQAERLDGAAAALVDSETGAADIRLSLAAPKALAKKADTSVTLDTLHLLLTSPGCPSRAVAVPVTGNVNSGSLAVSARVEGLKGLRNWKIKAWTRDLSGTVIHSDSTTFYVRPGDTAGVDLRLEPLYSVLVARFVSQDKRVSKIEKLVLRVDGVVVDDTTFNGKKELFDVKLSHKYLKVGAGTTVTLEALDRASPARVKYSQSITFSAAASRDTTFTIKLK